MSTLQLDEIITWINSAFGEDFPAAQAKDIEAITGVLGDSGFQRYLQDQVNRQVIRDYLVNAMVLGIISEGGLPAFARQISSEEGRATMALYMLMSSVEDARDLPALDSEIEPLKPLKPAENEHPHIKLVPS
ncbi:MAG: hypothetical protein HRT77_07290 [Halioglobus sp.]|nr:hypothetical protein [Halioglobus sp.]